ncbi:hypothetical protein ACQPXM_41185 (plasmid) [Kribbella sp. CA-253562]|uniref:hypothetical protein n=1 Tax=Kribbella sp. CA-253562 TaxID=3239942 RepID=UPI003D8D4C72
MNRRRLALTVVIAATIATAGTAYAAGAADPQPTQTTPTGLGDLLPTPDLTHGDTRNMFEAYSAMSYSLDTDEGKIPDGINGILNAYANLLLFYLVAITRAAITVGWWLFSFTDIKAVSDATSGIVTSASSALTSWLLPSALAFGAVLAFARHRGSREGGGFSQVLWVIASGLLAVSFTTGAATWVNGLDSARQLGATAVMDASTRTITSNSTEPFETPAPSYERGSERDKLLRQSADSTWRAFVVTPWCLAEFGSLEACKRYGKAILDRGTDADKRKKYINDELKRAEGGDDSPTVQWTKGNSPIQRIGIMSLAMIAAAIFAALSIALCFAALMAFIGALLLLVTGVFFACLWVIPGRPRQWGINWFEMLIGLVLQSILALLVFGTTLSLVTAIYSLSGTMGWLPTNGLAIVVLFAAFRLRRMLEGITQMMRPGYGSSGLVGAMALRQVTRGIGSLFRSTGRGQTKRTPKSRRDGGDRPKSERLPGDEDGIKPPPPRPMPPQEPQNSRGPRPRPGGQPGGRPGDGPGQQPEAARAEVPKDPAQREEQINVPRPRTVSAEPAGKDRHAVTVGDPDKIAAKPATVTPATTTTTASTSKPAPGDDGKSERHKTEGERLPSHQPSRGVGRGTTRPGDAERTHTPSRGVGRGTTRPGDAERTHTPAKAYRPGRATTRYETVRPSTPTLREGPPPPGARLRPVRPQQRTFRVYNAEPPSGPPPRERIPERTS